MVRRLATPLATTSATSELGSPRLPLSSARECGSPIDSVLRVVTVGSSSGKVRAQFVERTVLWVVVLFELEHDELEPGHHC